LDAGAQTIAGVTVNWQAPAGCGSEGEVHARLAQALGPDWSHPSQVAATALLERRDRSWRLEFSASVDGTISRRDLDVDSCEAAVVATALFTLLAVAPGMVEKLDVSVLDAPIDAAPPEIAPQATEAAPPPVVDDEVQAPSSVASPPSARAPGIATTAGVAGVIQTGLIADVTAGLEAMLNVHTQWLRLGARGQWFPAQSAELGGGPSVEMSLLGTGLEGGLLLHEERFIWGPFLGIGANFATGKAVGTTAPRSGDTSWIAISAGFGLDWPLSERWTLSATGGAVTPLHRPVFSISGLGPVHRPDPIEAKAGLGVSFELVSRN
jgi:hypothetical protein